MLKFTGVLNKQEIYVINSARITHQHLNTLVLFHSMIDQPDMRVHLLELWIRANSALYVARSP